MDTKIKQFVTGMSGILENAPPHLFIKDHDLRYVDFSQSLENTAGIKRKELAGKNDYATPWGDVLGSQFRYQDKMAMKNGCSDVFEPLKVNKSLVFVTRCIRVPIRDNTGKILGVMGQTIILSSRSNLCEAMQALMKIDKKNLDSSMQMNFAYQLKPYPNSLQLTSRETECLFLLVRGKTAKEIGKFLDISSRTVESHIENIKIKLNVSSRSQIISKAIDLGLLDIIPKNEILSHLYSAPDKWKQLL